MAGSYRHLVTDEGTYRGMELIDNMGDAAEAIDELFFILQHVSRRWGGHVLIEEAIDLYGRCLRGELPWPDYMKPGIETDSSW